jgi:anti-anti-sigma regulatory factor
MARSIAMETAAKIDAIENEMARDFLRTGIRNTGGPAVPNSQPLFDPALVETTSPPAAIPSPAAPAPTPRTPATPLAQGDEFDPGADVLETSVDAIEINTSGAGSIIDETAILFSNGQIDAAEAVLRAGIRADDLAHATQNAWLMLFELANQRGDHKAFDQLTMEYALRFENSPPAWFDYVDGPARDAGRRPAPVAAAGLPGAEPVVLLPEMIDAGVVKYLEQLKKVAAAHAALALDFSVVRAIDLVGAELLLRVINAFKRARHELTLIGIERFLGPLRSATEPGRRDASDALWMLLLEVLRVLDRQEEFDETAIQYCITFEVSPPSWEPPLPNIKPAPASAQDASVAVEAPSVDRFEWRGVIDGEGEPYFGRVLAAAPKSPQLVVDCEQLRRMAFSAASALLSLARRVQRMGSSLELRNVNPLVGALLHLLGVTGAATVHLRRG